MDLRASADLLPHGSSIITMVSLGLQFICRTQWANSFTLISDTLRTFLDLVVLFTIDTGIGVVLMRLPSGPRKAAPPLIPLSSPRKVIA